MRSAPHLRSHWHGLSHTYSFLVAVHTPSARPLILARPFAVPPSIHPARLAIAAPGSPPGPDQIPRNPSSTYPFRHVPATGRSDPSRPDAVPETVPPSLCSFSTPEKFPPSLAYLTSQVPSASPPFSMGCLFT